MKQKSCLQLLLSFFLIDCTYSQTVAAVAESTAGAAVEGTNAQFFNPGFAISSDDAQFFNPGYALSSDEAQFFNPGFATSSGDVQYADEAQYGNPGLATSSDDAQYVNPGVAKGSDDAKFVNTGAAKGSDDGKKAQPGAAKGSDDGKKAQPGAAKGSDAAKKAQPGDVKSGTAKKFQPGDAKGSGAAKNAQYRNPTDLKDKVHQGNNTRIMKNSCIALDKSCAITTRGNQKTDGRCTKDSECQSGCCDGKVCRAPAGLKDSTTCRTGCTADFKQKGHIGKCVLVCKDCHNKKQVCPTGTYFAEGSKKCLPSKRGICANLNTRGSQLLSTSGWSYNWGHEPSILNPNAIEQEFVPMRWSINRINELDEAIIRLKKAGFKIKHVLGYNEPNVKGQADISPWVAAKHWPQLVQVARKHGLLIGSPSTTGPTDDAIGWMQAWIKNHMDLYNKPPEFDFVTTHFYACRVDWLKGYINSYRDTFHKPIWLTEFACPQGNVEEQMTFMKESLQYLDGNPDVERYAWFSLDTRYSQFLGPNASLLSEDGQKLSKLGEVYQSFYPLAA